MLVRVDFTEDGLSYMDRLLLKTHHRWGEGRVQVPEGGVRAQRDPCSLPPPPSDVGPKVDQMTSSYHSNQTSQLFANVDQ